MSALQYKKSLESAAQSSQPMISLSDIAAIFGNLHEIYEMHSLFRKQLEPIVAGWNYHSEVGQLFKEMVLLYEPQFIVQSDRLMTQQCRKLASHVLLLAQSQRRGC